MTHEEEEPRTVVDDADDAYEAVRAICHSMPYNIPAPEAYRVLGNLKHAGGHIMHQALNDLAAGLNRSLNDFDYYMDDDSEPSEAIKRAHMNLTRAANFARIIGQELEQAQSEITALGYRKPGDPGYRPKMER